MSRKDERNGNVESGGVIGKITKVLKKRGGCVFAQSSRQRLLAVLMRAWGAFIPYAA